MLVDKRRETNIFGLSRERCNAFYVCILVIGVIAFTVTFTSITVTLKKKFVQER